MKIKSVVFYVISLFQVTIGHATGTQNNSNPSNPLGPFSLQALVNYNDFKFNSSSTGNYNRFQGHSDLYLVGGHDDKINESLSGGVLLYNVTTRITSNVLLAPASLVITNQEASNNNVMGHVLYQIKPNWYIDLLGNYGRSHLSYRTLFNANATAFNAPMVSRPTSHGNNWYASVTGEHIYPWHQFVLKGFLSLLHSEVYQSSYSYYFGSSAFAPNHIASISNQATFLLENAEIAYTVSPSIQPFVNGGLLQVLQYANSRPIVTSVALVGTLPEFNISQNGFRVGGGVSLAYKQVVLRLEQQYEQRGMVYHSNQTIAAITLTLG